MIKINIFAWISIIMIGIVIISFSFYGFIRYIINHEEIPKWIWVYDILLLVITIIGLLVKIF